MLDTIRSERLGTDLFRMATELPPVDSLHIFRGDRDSADELLDLLSSRGVIDNPEKLCDAPFRNKPRLWRTGFRTRFSDGSYPVFYSSLEPETATAEVSFWFSKNVSCPNSPRTVYYARFSCHFDGSVKDLRPTRTEWPELTHDTDYDFCNRLGKEAKASGLDGLLTPSARKEDGTNVPVFRRSAIGSPVIQSHVVMTLNPSTGDVAVRERDATET